MQTCETASSGRPLADFAVHGILLLEQRNAVRTEFFVEWKTKYHYLQNCQARFSSYVLVFLIQSVTVFSKLLGWKRVAGQWPATHFTFWLGQWPATGRGKKRYVKQQNLTDIRFGESYDHQNFFEFSLGHNTSPTHRVCQNMVLLWRYRESKSAEWQILKGL